MVGTHARAASVALAALASALVPTRLAGQQADEIVEMAIYRSTEEFHGDIPISQIHFHVTDRDTIQRLLSSIDFTSPRNGSLLGSITNLFVYLKAKDGTVGAYEIYLAGYYFAHRDKRERSYPISGDGRALFARLAQ